ncbi:unnamed protein product [Heterobilharzia americana]|nr:unnamed protein product [Heterobilharzia americana]
MILGITFPEISKKSIFANITTNTDETHIQITDHKIVPCIHATKSQTANNSQSCCPQQYLEQNNKSETSSNISLDEIYPYAVSRRPSVRDILRRKVKVSDHHHHHEDVNVSKQQQQPQQKYDFNEGQLVHYPKECPRLFGGSPNYCAVNNIPENMRTNFYISDDHFNCYQSNLCMNRTDYIFYENNLNMGVVAPPNLNPFTS